MVADVRAVSQPSELYQRLMDKEQRVLRTLDRLAEVDARRRERDAHILDRPLSVLWHDLNLALLRLVANGGWWRAVTREADTQMYLGAALALVALLALPFAAA
jgi:hypothetical protein